LSNWRGDSIPKARGVTPPGQPAGRRRDDSADSAGFVWWASFQAQWQAERS